MVSGQAAHAGDAQTSEETEGHYSVGFDSAPELLHTDQVEEPMEEPAENSVEPEPSNDEQKKKRISDAEWQSMVEKSKDFDSFKEALAKSLGLESDEEITDETLITKMQQDIDNLKRDKDRIDWEVDHPIVRSEKYAEKWKQVNSDEKYTGLSYEERWKLIKDEPDSLVKEELKQQERDSKVPSATPAASKEPVKGESPVADGALQMLRSAYPGMTDEEIKALAKDA